MDIYELFRELLAEKLKIDQAIAALEQIHTRGGDSRPTGPGPNEAEEGE